MNYLLPPNTQCNTQTNISLALHFGQHLMKYSFPCKAFPNDIYKQTIEKMLSFQRLSLFGHFLVSWLVDRIE